MTRNPYWQRMTCCFKHGNELGWDDGELCAGKYQPLSEVSHQSFAFWEDIPPFEMFQARYGYQEDDFTYIFLKVGKRQYLHLDSPDDDFFNIENEYLHTWAGDILLDYHPIQNLFEER